MDSRSSIRVPIIASEAFYRATEEMMFNETANWIKYDHKSIGALSQALRDMGQTRFINMNAGTEEARISLVLYAGDGNIVKIMPRSYTGPDYPLQMPPISERDVETEDRAYVIRTYPYLTPQKVTQDDVEYVRRVIGALGLDFNPGDDTPRNLMHLPDKERTLVAIDADTFRETRGGPNYGPELVQAWQDYLAEIFPAYKDGAIPRQTQDTDFRFKMNANHETGLSRFDPLSANPAVYATMDRATKPKHSFWDIFTKLGHD